MIAVAAEKPQVPSPAALRALARAELRTLGAALGKAKAGESVHGARRQIKRARSLLRLLREPMGEEAFAAANASLRGAADALAGQRRAEALVLAAGGLGSRTARGSWQQLAEAHREAHAAEAAADGGLEAARKSIAAAAETLAGLRLRSGHSPAIMEAFLGTYRKARKRLGHGLSSRDAEELHTARKHVIHHLHHIDLLRAHLSGPAKRIAALEKLREALGDLNDLDELSQLAAAAQTSPPDSAAKAMAKRRAMLLKRVEKAAHRLFRKKPRTFQKGIGAMWAVAKG